MNTVKLIRLECRAEATLGALVVNEFAVAATLELPWRDNMRFISCIPTGAYVCRKMVSAKFGSTFQVMGVPGRSGILFHPGNTAGATKGCILLGQYWDKLKGERAVRNSGATHRKFMDLVYPEEEFGLMVVEVS